MALLLTPWVVATVILALGARLAVPRIVANVHTVVPGEVFRSAQLSAAGLETLIKRRQLRSVLNLRGASPGLDWYEREREVAARNGVELIDFELWSAREVTAEQAEQLVALMRSAPKPMLIHCWGGADRTGLAAALYLFVISNRQAGHAARALSIWFHHLSFTSARAMDRSFHAFVKAASTKSQRG